MRIGFIGAGKVGFTLGKYFTEHGVCVSGYYGRNKKSSDEAAKFTKTKRYGTMEELIESSDALFLTVPDGSIREVYSEIRKSDIKGKILCHCSGSLSSEVFWDIKEKGAFGYSIHPMYAVSDRLTSYREFSNVYFTIEGDERYLLQLKEMIASLGNPVEVITPKEKVRYHGAAVFASNLAAGLYDCASELLCTCGLSSAFAQEALRPLFLGNAKKIAKLGVESALTGPIERGDLTTVQNHLNVLTEDEREIYCLLSKRLVGIAKRKNAEKNYDAIENLLLSALEDCV